MNLLENSLLACAIFVLCLPVIGAILAQSKSAREKLRNAWRSIWA